MFITGKLILSNEKLLYMPTGTKILKLRKKFNLSQFELAAKLDISQATLSDIESSKNKKIDFVLIHKICQIFQVSYDYFIENENLNNNKVDENPKISNANLIESILLDINSKLQKIENKLDRK